MLMDNGRHPESYRRCTGCGRRCGRARRCIGCTRITTNFEEELARARQVLNEQARVRAMEEGTLTAANNSNASQGEIENNTAEPQIDVVQQTLTTTTATTSSRLPENFNRFRMSGLNWGVWCGFIFGTALLVPSHIYLKKYDYRGELLGIFFVLTLLFLVCFSVSMFHSKTREILLHRFHLEEDLRNCPAPNSPTTRRRRYRRNNCFSSRHNHYPLRRVRSTPELQANDQSTSPRPAALNLTRASPAIRNPRRGGTREIGANNLLGSSSGTSDISNNLDPPPYHLAILLPSPPYAECPIRRCETPPPSYEHIQ